MDAKQGLLELRAQIESLEEEIRTVEQEIEDVSDEFMEESKDKDERMDQLNCEKRKLELIFNELNRAKLHDENNEIEQIKEIMEELKHRFDYCSRCFVGDIEWDEDQLLNFQRMFSGTKTLLAEVFIHFAQTEKMEKMEELEIAGFDKKSFENFKHLVDGFCKKIDDMEYVDIDYFEYIEGLAEELKPADV